MNYGELRSQFSGLLNRRDITTSLRDTFIQQAISRAQRKLRVPAMEASVSVTWDNTFTNSELPIPSTYLELRDLTHTGAFGSHTLEQMPIGNVLWRIDWMQGQRPEAYARRGSKWVIGPTPTNGDVVRIDFYAELPALVNDADTNWLTVIAPEVVLYGALSYACDYFIDNRKDRFEAAFEQSIGEVQGQADADEISSGAVVSPAFYYPEDN